MPNWYEWIGYAASLIVLISLIMSSVKRLRWINMIGSLIFSIYGILISSYPVALMNLGIVIVNIYYLRQIYSRKDLFKLISIENNIYLNHFMEVYKKDMSHFIDVDQNINEKDLIRYFVIRNTIPAGLFVGKPAGKNTLEILIDYSTPTYRDFKIAQYLYDKNKEVFLSQGFKVLISKPGQSQHQNYLEKIGFKLSQYKNESYYMKEIQE